jgi:hypothetical protein
MSDYVRRFSKFPRPAHSAHSARLHGYDGLGQPPITRDVVNSLPMPIDPGVSRRDLPIWLYPPVNFENVDQLAYVLLPAIGATATIITFTVPIGRNGMIQKVACNFVGGGWTEGTGDVKWRVLVDGTPPPGATSYDSIVASLGSPAQPVGIAGFRIFENQVLTLVAFNDPAGPNGGVIVAGQRVGGRLMGYLYPRDLEQDDIWI